MMIRDTVARPIALLLLLSLLLFSTSCEEVKHEYCELGIKLTGDFKPTDGGGGFDVAYSDGRIFVGILRISLDAPAEAEIPTTMTPLKLAAFYLNRSGAADRATEILEEGDVPYFTFRSEDGERFYVPTFYVTPYAYFVITFITVGERGIELLPEILSYTEGVYINL